MYREAPENIRVENPYVVGNNILKRDNIKKHSTSHRHILARDAFIAKQHPERAGTLLHSLRTQVTKADDAALREVKMKINVVYCIAKEELPFNKFKPLILLCKKNGADISPSYDNHVRCGEMIETIADEMKSDLAEEIGGSRYLSVMIDGDTDASNKECEMVYVRIIINGKPTNKLIGQQELEHSHALGVLQATKTAFEQLGQETGWMNKLVGFGADGAAVNMGHRGGVIALLKEEVGEHVIPWHCMPRSPKSQRELQAVGNMLGVNISNPSSVKGTRWIPHVERALHALLKPAGQDEQDSGQYVATLQHMSHLSASSPSADVKGRAKKIKCEMERAEFCAFSHFMADVFAELGSLSRILQANDLILPKASAELQRTVSELEGMKLRHKPGGMLEKFLSSQPEGESVTFQGMELKGQVPLTDGVFSNLHVAAAVDIAVEEMRSRFSCLMSQSGEGVVDSFRIFNHDAWPESQGALLDYGRAEVQSLLQHFGELLRNGGCQSEQVLQEWQQLKTLIRTTFADKSYLGLWQTLLTKEPYRSDFECERGFSAQNRIKNTTRSSLHISTAEDLIRISTEGCPLEQFNPSHVTAKWLSSSKRARRPNMKKWPADMLDL
ncbi:hypothetical protein SKAU_G00193830 [Synaphobranchus kaupii]|uniref:DUF4371 domain-containing protein n=1 Tax=Synaphobranchus kaupii TaxID=118154 RepID=A0A9Q1IWM1_SYNKA|nr:hypothetical protein SKAU_G00193830 [Synaphobranchus kaupii]